MIEHTISILGLALGKIVLPVLIGHLTIGNMSLIISFKS